MLEELDNWLAEKGFMMPLDLGAKVFGSVVIVFLGVITNRGACACEGLVSDRR